MAATAMTKERVETLKIENLQIDTFVREALDPEYIFHLATMYEANAKMNPILVTKSNRVIDGRCRIEASKLAGKVYIDAVVIDDCHRKEMLAKALISNLGGSRAPTKGDILFTLEAMVKSGASERYIREEIPFPKEVLDKYLGEVRGAIQRQKITQARHAIADKGLTVEQAANEFGLTVSRLQQEIHGRTSTSRVRDNIAQDLRTGVTRRNVSTGRRNMFTFKTTVEAYKEGSVTKEQAMKIFDEIERHGELSVKSAMDFRKRFLQTAVI